MNTTCYLLDNNALSRLSRQGRSHRIVRERCRIPTEVLHEAAGYPDIASLRELEYVTNAEILNLVSRVMASETPGDTSLVDLYANKGNADPILVATALHARALSEESLFPEEWVVVSNDDAVIRCAATFGVPTLRPDEFRELLRPDVLLGGTSDNRVEG